MRMNRSMAGSLAKVGLDERNPRVEVNDHLLELAAANLVAEEGCIVLAPLAQVGHYDSSRFQDRTGYECLANKIHIEDFLDGTASALEQLRQGVGYAVVLAKRLVRSGRFLVILSVDRNSGDLVVRFHQQRPNENWVMDDLEGYEMEDMLVWEPHDFAQE